MLATNVRDLYTSDIDTLIVLACSRRQLWIAPVRIGVGFP